LLYKSEDITEPDELKVVIAHMAEFFRLRNKPELVESLSNEV